jgi:hypothetical protein
MRLGNGAQAPEAHFDLFLDWQEITNVWFSIEGEPPPRDTRAS